MNISVFDLFKIGIGPSSSHTVGPMKAACLFIRELEASGEFDSVESVKIELFGSLSATGAGHNTHNAVIMGLMGYQPDVINPDVIDPTIQAVCETSTLIFGNKKPISFDWDTQLIFDDRVLDYHPNAMTLSVFDADQQLIKAKTYYSIGGGFVLDEHEIQDDHWPEDTISLPYDYSTGEQLLSLCKQHDARISEIVMANEIALRPQAEVRETIFTLWNAMQECITTGIENTGILPGGLNVKRRAAALHKALTATSQADVIYASLSGMDWVNLFALAVNEENAAGGRMVTAPTNGAAGIIPAVLAYHMRFHARAKEEDVITFFLAASAVGALCKKNASISGAIVFVGFYCLLIDRDQP